jgi:uncharacterized membrane protein
MAGIGFTLKKLTRKDDLFGVVHAYGSAILASAGPWIFTVITLAGITNLYSNFFAMEGLLNFRVIVIYNFAFSLVLSAPVFMVATRYVADQIHSHNVTNVPSVMIGSMLMLYSIQFPIVSLFYFGYVDEYLGLQISAVINVLLLTTVWLLGVFLTALKDYNAVSAAYAIGMVISIVMAQILKDEQIAAQLGYAGHEDAGMLNGFSMGLAFIVFSLAAKVFSEYSYKFSQPFAIRPYFKKYWEIALGGFLYNAAIWVDKWIMWFADESWILDNGLRMYPDYDSATFMAYLTIVPAMGVFMFSVETNFFEKYQRFYDGILEHKPLRKIKEYQQAVMDSIANSARNFIVVQGTIAFLCIMLAPQIFEFINATFTQVGMFRIATLGAFFHVLLLFAMIVLSYFDSRRTVLWLGGIYFLLNTIFTLITLELGFPYYGYGYFLSSMIIFVVTILLLFRYVRDLPFHAFVTTNSSL